MPVAALHYNSMPGDAVTAVILVLRIYRCVTDFLLEPDNRGAASAVGKHYQTNLTEGTSGRAS